MILLLLAAGTPWWDATLFGKPLPENATLEEDWPFGVDTRCGWIDEVLYCERSGEVHDARRRIDQPVEGGTRRWLRSAGLEWRSYYVLEEDGVTTWGAHVGPMDGWQHTSSDDAPVGTVGLQLPPARAVDVEGGEWTGEQRVSVAAALHGCRLPTGAGLPLAVLYDSTHEARLVRFQSLDHVIDAWAMACVVRAVGEPTHAGDSVEIVLRPR